MKDEQICHKRKAWLVLIELEGLKKLGQWELRSEGLKYWLLLCWRVSVNVGVSV